MASSVIIIVFYYHVHACQSGYVVIRAGPYQKFHITIIMTVNIPIIDIIAISAELTVAVLQALKL